MGKSQYSQIPSDHHVARRCSAQRLVTDENGIITGVSPAFFSLRPHMKENDLSCNWVEHIEGTRDQQLASCKESMKKIRGGAGSRVIISSVDKVRAIGTLFKTKLVIKTKGKKADPSYSGVYGLPLDNSNGDLIAALVDGAVNDIVDLAPWPR